MLRIDRTSAIAAPEISPELKVLFPKIKDIAITTTVFASPAEQSVDTANVALIRTHGRFDHSERTKLAEYLETRLKLGKVEVVSL